MLISTVVDKKNRVRELIHLLKEADIDVNREKILRVIMIPADLIIDEETDWEETE